MRVGIIGPVEPYRSGIARHTTALARELATRSDVEVRGYSFRRLYPDFLYPGDRQLQKNASPPGEFEVEYRLESLNPLSWWKASHRIVQWGGDVAVIPAWTAFVAPCLGSVAFLLRRHGISVILVAHNAEDHENAWWKSILSQYQLSQASRIVAHNAAIKRDIKRLVPTVPVSVHPHPLYEDFPEPRGTLRRTAALELLFFGIIRHYKGLDIALRAVATCGLDDVRLSVVGEFWEDRNEIMQLIKQLSLEEKLEVVPRYVSDQEAAEYFDRCDAVLAPYRSATGSGVVALAHRYRRPVIVSDVDGLTSSVTDGSTGWIFSAGDPSALARLLKSKVTRTSAEGMRSALERLTAERTWERFADAILEQARRLSRDTEMPA